MNEKSIISVDIQKTSAKIIQAEISSGAVKITKTASAELDSFSDSGTLNSLGGLVSTICEKISESGMTAKNILLCSPFLGGEATLSSAEKAPASVAELLQKKPFENSGIGSGKAKKSYGTLQKDGKMVEYFIESSADEFLLSEMAGQFSECGFCLKSVEYSTTALLNLTSLSPYTYDAQYKIIVDISDKVTAVITERDVPVEIRRWNVDFASLETQLTDFALRDTAALHLKNPTILLCGARLSTSKYKAVKEELESAGFIVSDCCAAILAEPSFWTCLGLALRSKAKTKTNLLPQKTRYFLPSKVMLKAVKCIKTAAFALLFFSVFLCGFSAFKIFRANLAFSEIPALQMQLDTASAKITALNESVETIENADSKLSKYLTFSQNYDKGDIFTASADTENLLRQAAVESGLDIADIIPTETNERKLIVRGYALSGKAALDFYDALQAADFAPKMNGLQTEELPSGEAVTIFELEMIL